jgi:hypothetical protein
MGLCVCVFIVWLLCDFSVHAIVFVSVCKCVWAPCCVLCAFRWSMVFVGFSCVRRLQPSCCSLLALSAGWRMVGGKDGWVGGEGVSCSFSMVLCSRLCHCSLGFAVMWLRKCVCLFSSSFFGTCERFASSDR